MKTLCTALFIFLISFAARTSPPASGFFFAGTAQNEREQADLHPPGVLKHWHPKWAILQPLADDNFCERYGVKGVIRQLKYVQGSHKRLSSCIKHLVDRYCNLKTLWIWVLVALFSKVLLD